MTLLNDTLFETIEFTIVLIPVLISVAYLTLAESKTLGYTQSSKGPNIVGLFGLFQPIADGLNLFSKETITPNHVNILLYFFAPILSLSIALAVWGVIPLGSGVVVSDLELGLLLIFSASSIGVYAILISGWSSNSNYAFLGALSAGAQMISYEVSLGLIVISVLLCVGSLNLLNISQSQELSVWFVIPLLPSSLLFFISCLAETNSAPFDLTEGESELVSGFNVEYSSMSFALFFLAEYAHIIFMSYLFTLLFLGGYATFGFNTDISLFVKGGGCLFGFIWVSTSFPSISYDQLMNLLWKTFLPLSLSMIITTNTLIWGLNALPPNLCI